MLFCIYRRSKKDRTVFFQDVIHDVSPIISDFQLSNSCFSMAGFSQEATALWGRSITGALWRRSPGHPGCRPTHTLASGMMWRNSRWWRQQDPDGKFMVNGYLKKNNAHVLCQMPEKKKGSLFYRWFDYKMHHQGYSLDMFISFRAQHKR